MAGASRSQKSRRDGQRPSLFIPHGLSPSCLEEERGRTLLGQPSSWPPNQPNLCGLSLSACLGSDDNFSSSKAALPPTHSTMQELHFKRAGWRRRAEGNVFMIKLKSVALGRTSRFRGFCRGEVRVRFSRETFIKDVCMEGAGGTGLAQEQTW